MANLIEKSCKTPGRGSKPVTYIAFDGPATVKEVMDALEGNQNKLHAILARGFNAQARAEAVGADEFSAFVHFLAPLDESTASQFKRGPVELQADGNLRVGCHGDAGEGARCALMRD